MTNQKTTKNRKLGVIGLTSVAAILSIALLTASLSGIQAQAEPANKVSWMNDDEAITYGWSAGGGHVGVAEVVLQKFTLKTSDK